MKIYKYFLSLYAVLVATIGALANTSTDFIHEGERVIAIASTGPKCEKNKLVTICTLGRDTGVVIYDTFDGAKAKLIADAKKANIRPDPF